MLKKKTIKKHLYILSERNSEIMILRYGLNGDEPKTLEHLGVKFDLTRERIRQIQNECIDKIRIEMKNIKFVMEELKFINSAILFFEECGLIRDIGQENIFKSIINKIKKLYGEK